MTRDGHVRVLPLHVANKIAAGEVVERPASVLKELLENALDAGATRIEAVVTAGGRKLVAVRDDGCGMTREDAINAFEPHATSKIRDVDDIENIDTLGFRGEAIPSIASVSRFTLVTRRAEADEGTRIVRNAGVDAEIKSAGAPPGTTIEVRDLFCNVPARRKFLRSYATEESHVKNVFTVHALAHPDVGFSLTIDGREIYRFAPGATLEERIHDLFGASFADALVAVDATVADVHVYGYVERPDRQMDVRRDQYVFTNGRPATAATISYALKEAYPRARGEARPAVILFIDLPAGQVDVNVHPTKREVRFRRPQDVGHAIETALTAALQSTGAAASPPAEAAPLQPTPAPFVVPFQSSLPLAPISPHAEVAPPPAASAPASESFAGPRAAQTQPFNPSTFQPSNPSTFQPSNPSTVQPPPNAPWRWFKVLALTDSGYLLLETDAGIVTVDPVAAAERIAYEALLDGAHAASQPLLIPETIQFGPAESARLKTFVDVLTAQGFALEEFGRDVWKVDAVPQLIGDLSAEKVISSIVYDITEAGGAKGGNARWREELIARSVARSYAGASPKLTVEGAVKLMEALAACRSHYVCPRGKPVMIFTSNAELRQKFKR